MIYFLGAAVLMTAIAAMIDWRTGEIPNWLTLGPVVIAPLAYGGVTFAHGGTGMEAAESVGTAVLGVIVCSIIPLVLYRQNGIGGGDVKLLAALGAILGWRWGIEAQMYSFFAAGLLAPARLAYEGKLFRTLKNSALLAMNPLLPKKKRRPVEPTLLTWFRFGPAVFLGTAVATYLHWRS